MNPSSPSTTPDPARRWASVPGVTYPAAAPAPSEPTNTIPTTPPPVPTVTTADVAAILGLTPSAAYHHLTSHRISSWLRRDADNVARRHWSRDEVAKMLPRIPTIDPIPPGYCDWREALSILRISRATLSRRVADGTIRQLLLRRPRAALVAYYERAALLHLAAASHTRKRLWNTWNAHKHTEKHPITPPNPAPPTPQL